MTDITAKRADGMTLEMALAIQYPMHLLADPNGGYVVVFPDLPGCLSGADCLAEIPAMADEARRLWITTAFEDGESIPRPSYPPEYSGKFQLRVPASLHRALAESAEYESVSLNTYVVSLLSRADAESRLARGKPARRQRSA